MASWNAPIDRHPGRGPKVITIHGQAYHLTSQADPPDGERRQYAQLYILDSNQALRERAAHPDNVNLQLDILRMLQDELTAVNPFAAQFRNMGQILERERNSAAANNQPVPPVRMIMARCPHQDRRYDDPVAREVAAVYVGNDGAPPNPADRDIVIYPTADNNTIHIQATSPNADPITKETG